MSNTVKIDGTDIVTLGMFILKGGDFDLLSFPDRKEPIHNDWFEHDGLDCELSEVLFEAKKVKVKYYLVAENSTAFQERLNAFENLHFQKGYRSVWVEAFQRTFSLRTLSVSKYEHKGGFIKLGKKSASIEVTYSMDEPLQYFIAGAEIPNQNRPHLAQVALNGYDFSKFGVVIQNAYDTALQPASPKTGVVWESNHATGLTADVDYVPKKKSRKLVLECTMLTENYGDFEHNYTALFRQLTKSGEITIDIANGSIPCYYSKMQDFRKKKPLQNGANVTFKLELITL